MHRLPQPSPHSARSGGRQDKALAPKTTMHVPPRWSECGRIPRPPAVLDRDPEASRAMRCRFPCCCPVTQEAEQRAVFTSSRFAVASGGLLCRQDKGLPAKAAIVVVAPGFVGCQRPKRRKRGRVRPRPLRPRAVGLYRAPVGRATEPPARKASASRPVRVTIPPAASRRRQMRGSDGLLAKSATAIG